MSDDLSRSLRRYQCKRVHTLDDGLAVIRQYYYELRAKERLIFRQQIEALEVASLPFASSPFTVEMNYQATWHPSGGEGDSISETASVSPKQVLEAIAEWDGADEEEQNPSGPVTLG